MKLPKYLINIGFYRSYHERSCSPDTMKMGGGGCNPNLPVRVSEAEASDYIFKCNPNLPIRVSEAEASDYIFKGDSMATVTQKSSKQVTIELPRLRFDLYISQLVFQEANAGDKEASEKRQNILRNIPILELREEAIELAEKFVQANVLPQKAGDDALHIAVATVYDLDYLLTWNCKHIANAVLLKKIASIAAEQGYELPTICTPYELMGE